MAPIQQGLTFGCEGMDGGEEPRRHSDFPPTAHVLCFLDAEEGTREGDDEGVPPVSQRGERQWRGMRAGCVGRAWLGQATRVRPRALAGQRGREGELGQQLGAREV